jgi:hypothetical protein
VKVTKYKNIKEWLQMYTIKRLVNMLLCYSACPSKANTPHTNIQELVMQSKPLKNIKNRQSQRCGFKEGQQLHVQIVCRVCTLCSCEHDYLFWNCELLLNTFKLSTCKTLNCWAVTEIFKSMHFMWNIHILNNTHALHK